MHIGRLLAVLFVGVAAAQPKPEILIGAAANLTNVFRSIGPKFEAETGIHPVFSFASTAQLTQQAAHGAPFDLIAAADSEHVEQLEHEGLLVPGSRAVYAKGVIALWVPPRSQTLVRKLEDLADPRVRVIAIAKPELAPYGEASVTALKRAGLWERVRSKVVYSENINMARQYGASGNADAVFTAYPLVMHEAGAVLRIEPRLYPSLDQSLGILASSRHVDAARKFSNFLLIGAGSGLLREFGYERPAR